MADLAVLNEELEQAVARHDALRLKYPGAVMPDDLAAEDDAVVKRIGTIRVMIKEEQQRQRDAMVSNTADWMDKPEYQVRVPVDTDADGVKTLRMAGWEVKNGMWEKQTSLGKSQPMYGEDVLFGKMPSAAEDSVAAAYFKQTRAIIQPEYRDAWIKWFRTKGVSDSMAFAMLSTAEQKALSEGTDGAGGFVVPPDVQAEILVRLPQMSVMRRLARTVQTSRDELKWPAVKANASSGSIYSSGFVGGWVGETPAFSETDPSFEQFSIGIKKARVATKVSNDWLADAAANMLAFLAQNGAENMALVEDNGFIAGVGSSNQPLGILNCGITTVDVEGSTSDTISNSTSNAGSFPKIESNLIYGVPSQYADRGSFLLNRAMEGKVRGLVDGNGRPIWLGANDSGFGATPRQINGYPVYNSEFVPSDGTNANKVIIFGDFSAYIIAERAQLSTVVLRERFADTDQTGIILFSRVGGGLWNTDALRIGIV